MINRGALILNYKEPFIKWVIQADPYDKDFTITLEEANEDNVAYLISDNDAEKLDKWLKANYLELFERALERWYTDEELWPQKLSYKMFREWFEVECHSIVCDLVEDRIIDDGEQV